MTRPGAEHAKQATEIWKAKASDPVEEEKAEEQKPITNNHGSKRNRQTICLRLGKGIHARHGDISATYWLPFDDLTFDEKSDNAVADQAVGVIEDSIGEYRVKNYADGSFKVPMVDQSTGLLFLSLLGAQAVAHALRRIGGLRPHVHGRRIGAAPVAHALPP